MPALPFGNLLQSNILPRMQSKPGNAVSSHSQPFLFRFSDPLSLDQCGSVCRRCVPSSPQNFHEKCGLVILLTASWALPISVPVLMVFLPPSFPKKFMAMTSFSLSYFVIIFSYFMIVVFLLRYKKKRRDLTARTVSIKFTSRREVRVAYTLAIATGVFTVCWVPVKTMRFVIGMKPNSPLHMWLRTLALSNSAMNFLIYSARMRAIKEAYLNIFQKICRL